MKKEETRLERAATTWLIFCIGMLFGAALFGWYCNHIGAIDRGMHLLVFVLGYPSLFFLAILPRLCVEIPTKLKKLKKESDSISQNRLAPMSTRQEYHD